MRERLTRWNGNRWILPQGRTSDGESYWRIIADRLAEYENKEFGVESLPDNTRYIGEMDGYEIYQVKTVWFNLFGFVAIRRVNGK